MFYPIPLTFKSSAVRAVGLASAQFATVMDSGVQYVLRANTNLWWRADSANPTASAGDGSHFLAAGQTALIGGAGYKVAVIRDTADGTASLSVIGPQT